MPDKIYLRQMQGLPLIVKVRKTKLRIAEWYEHFEGNVYVSFSGGKDSTVLAHLVHEMYPDVPLIFSNTGLEYPEIQAFARKMGAEFVRPKMQFSDVISQYGYPIISKEVADAIFYARKIRGGGWRNPDLAPEKTERTTHTEHKRLDLTGQRTFERFTTTERKRGQLDGIFNKSGNAIKENYVGGGMKEQALTNSEEESLPG
jgi:3'-phosphoadenosine 5'-phosphosulfate sulfotransferase (PAPS reductase)/FAD synthetase